jgi:hypothetical protein
MAAAMRNESPECLFASSVEEDVPFLMRTSMRVGVVLAGVYGLVWYSTGAGVDEWM